MIREKMDAIDFAFLCFEFGFQYLGVNDSALQVERFAERALRGGGLLACGGRHFRSAFRCILCDEGAGGDRCVRSRYGSRFFSPYAALCLLACRTPAGSDIALLRLRFDRRRYPFVCPDGLPSIAFSLFRSRLDAPEDRNGDPD